MNSKKNTNVLQRKKNQGFTMVELLIGITVIGSVIFGILLGYTTFTERQNVNDFVQDSVELAAGVKDAFGKVERTYASVTNAAVLAAKVAPHLVLGSNYKNPWGGTIAFAKASINSGTDNAFTMTSASVPQSQCMRVAENLGDSFPVVSINSTVVRSATVALTAAGIAGACTSATNNAIELTYQ